MLIRKILVSLQYMVMNGADPTQCYWVWVVFEPSVLDYSGCRAQLGERSGMMGECMYKL